MTFDEWDACVAAGGCNGYEPHDEGWGRGRRPVIGVSWNDAKAYVEWLSGVTGKEYRLASEAEWEYAARARSETAFWWGEEVGSGHANCDSCGSQWDNRQSAPVGSFAANDFGLNDTAGNVWEWAEDCHHDRYAGAPEDGSSWTDDDCGRRVLRGGSWYVIPEGLRSANRGWGGPVIRNDVVGFRVARTLSRSESVTP